jgi:ABC-type antimicrobial peptide transport system permease subunit
MNDRKSTPPAFIIRILRSFCPDDLLEEIEGDLFQRFERDVKRSGLKQARVRFVRNAVSFFRPGIVFRNKVSFQLIDIIMWRNNLKIAVRSAIRHKGFSTINIAGLAAGITCTVLIMLWVQNELSYDRFHPDINRIYEAWSRDTLNGKLECWDMTPRVLAPTLKAEYPEVEQAISYADYDTEFLITKGDVKFTDHSGAFTSSEFLSTLGFSVVAGDAKTALNDPFSIVLTEKFAERVFGDETALGKSLTFRYGNDEMDFSVTGVVKDLPNNTMFDFGYLMSWELLRAMGENDTFWGSSSVRTFVKLRPGVSLDRFNMKMSDIASSHSEGRAKNEFFLYPVSELRLHSRFVNGIPDGGRIEVVRLFELIALFIILISCINFMNLSTARYERRAREVGIRKSVGALHRSLVGQFLTESLFIAFLAGIVAVFASHLSLPFFNTLTEKHLSIDYHGWQYWCSVGAIVIVAGLLAGSYPAFFLSSFRPVRVLKGNYVSTLSGAAIRKTLVVFQFAFTIILAVATLVVREQINFAQHRDTGYSKDELIYHAISGDIERNYAAYKRELLDSRVALSVSKVPAPITEHWSSTPALEWEGHDPNTNIIFDRYSADEGLVTTAGLHLVSGRDINLTDFASDSSAALINETAVKVMNFKNPIGASFHDGGKEFHIVGVVSDFITGSPYNRTGPMVIEGSLRGMFSTVLIRLNNKLATAEAVSAAGRTFRKYNPAYPFEYHFTDVEYERKFSDEKRTQTLSGVSGALAIFISCLGVLGLSIHLARRRLKEIGIRKVFGASSLNVMAMLLREPVRLILVAFVIASPIAWWAMQAWLMRYQYKVEIGWEVFALAGLSILLLAVGASGLQTIRAALINPANTLKDE